MPGDSPAIQQQSIGAMIAATGMIGGQAQPGQRGPLWITPGLAYPAPFDPTNIMGFLSRPISYGIGGIFFGGGAHNQRLNQAFLRQMQHERDTLGKVNSEGYAVLQQNAAAAAQALQNAGVQQASADQIFGNGLPRGFGGRLPSGIDFT